MIINIRGTNGSGKSTLVRNLLAKGTPRPIYGLLGPRKPEAYRLDLGELSIFVLGPYESSKTGVGCDAITDYSSIIALIQKYVSKGHVVFEGAMISAVWGALGALLDSIEPPPIVAFLDTPLDQCISDIRARTSVSNKLHTVEQKYKYLVKLRQRLLAEGRLRVVDLSRERGAEHILEELQRKAPTTAHKQKLSTGEFGGITAYYRAGTSDESVLREVLVQRNYRKVKDNFDVEKGENWLDLGANIGAFALYCKVKGASAECYEPVPSCFEILLKNAEGFDCKNCAVSNRPDGLIDFVVSKNPLQHHRGTMLDVSLRPCTEGKLKNLHGGFLRDLIFDGIKMDIEGSEFGLLDEWLLPKADKLVLEYHTSRDDSMGNLRRRLRELKRRYRYVSYPPEFDRRIAEGGFSKTYFDRIIYCRGLC